MFCDNCPCKSFCEPVLIMDMIPKKSHCDEVFKKLPQDDDSISSDDFWYYKIYTEGNDIILSMNKEWVEDVLCGKA